MNLDFRTTPIQLADDLRVAHIGEYFGVWAIHEDTFRSLVESCNGMDLTAHVRQQLALPTAMRADGQRLLETKQVALASAVNYASAASDEKKLGIVTMTGPLMKYTSSLSGGTSTVRVRQALRELARDDSIAGIMLHIDSPGGTVSGTFDLAADVAEIVKKKPVYGFFEDLGASAAYWIGSQAQRLFVNDTGMAGSIGTFATIIDSSKEAEQAGFKVHVVRAGTFKGMGVEGTEVTEEQLTELQRVVNELNEFFLAGVSSGRKIDMKQVRAIADGRVHVGAEAVKLGLVDAVSTFDDAMAELAAAVSSPPSKKRGKSMSQETTETEGPKAATLTELKAAFPTSTAEFRESQLEAGATIAQAKQAWEITQREDQIAKLKAENEKLAADKAEAEKKLAAQPAPVPPKKTAGVAPIDKTIAGSDNRADGISDAEAEWNAAIKAEMDLGRDKVSATRNVIRTNPQLHENYIQSVNEGRTARPFQPA